MGTGKRYSFKGHPGPTKTISFRVTEAAETLLEDRVTKLVAAGELANRTDALQDALVKWLMLEEHAEMQAAEVEDAPLGTSGT